MAIKAFCGSLYVLVLATVQVYCKSTKGLTEFSGLITLRSNTHLKSIFRKLSSLKLRQPFIKDELMILFCYAAHFENVNVKKVNFYKTVPDLIIYTKARNE